MSAFISSYAVPNYYVFLRKINEMNLKTGKAGTVVHPSAKPWNYSTISVKSFNGGYTLKVAGRYYLLFVCLFTFFFFCFQPMCRVRSEAPN
jgi:hypothetical protein